jgi:tRNA pseudouridine38-40 synthase
MRIALGLQYDGAGYHGWQKQPELKTVQATLEAALSEIAHHPIQAVCAGRTDTGVHASGQIVHFDTTVRRDKAAWIYGTNSILPHNIVVLWAREIDENFHARYKATSRHYRYLLCNRPIRPAYGHHCVSWHYEKLNHELMAEGANYLIGEHDFTSYRAVGCQASSPIKTITRLSIVRHGDLIMIDLVADGFLHHMVRNIVGVLLQIGTGKQAPQWTDEVLRACDRRQGGVTASPYGLYLANVYYPEQFEIPEISLPMISI